MALFNLDDKEVEVSCAAFTAGGRYTKKLFMQKACKWLKENATHFSCNPDKIVEQFKQAMNNERE